MGFDCWNFISNIDLEREDNYKIIEKNREKIILGIVEYFPNTNILIWAKSGKFERSQYFVPSRLFANGDFIVDINLDNQKVEVHEGAVAKMYDRSRAIFSQFDDASGDFDWIPLANPISRPTRSARDVDEMLGYVFSRSKPENQQELTEALRALAHALSLAITDGRYIRRVAAYEELDSLLSQQQSPKELVGNVESVLRSYCGMKTFSFISFQGEQKTLKLEGLKTLKSFGAIEGYSDLSDVVIVRNDKNASYIIAPITEPAIKIVKQSVQPISQLFAGPTGKYIVNFAIGLKEKERNSYTSNHISNTSGDIAGDIASAFEKLFSATVYEHRTSILASRLESLDSGVHIDANIVFKLIEGGLLKCSGVAVIEENTFDGSVVTNVAGKASLDRTYVQRMQSFMRNRKRDQFLQDSRVEIGLDDSKNKFKVESFIITGQESARLVVFFLESNLISKVDIQFINHLSAELSIVYKNQDAMQQRAAEIAHVRHTIMTSISASANAIEGFYILAKEYMFNDQLWKKFRTDPSWDDVKKASSFIATTRNLADNGALLFRGIQGTDITKRPYNLEALVKNITEQIRVVATAEEVHVFPKVVYSRNYTEDRSGTPIGNFDLLSLMFINLLDNAVKYTIRTASLTHYKNEYAGNEISLDKPIVKFNIAVNEQSYKVSVENIGRYIPESERELIFQPFRRGLSRYGYNKVAGTGIGLPTARLIARAHHIDADIGFSSTRIPNADVGIAINTFFCEMPINTTAKGQQ